MKAFALIGLMTFPTLAGCDQSSPATGSAGQDGHGRYSGIGIYEAGRLWAQVELILLANPRTRQG